MCWSGITGVAGAGIQAGRAGKTIQVDVRVIAAAHRNPDEAASFRFVSGLYPPMECVNAGREISDSGRLRYCDWHQKYAAIDCYRYRTVWQF